MIAPHCDLNNLLSSIVTHNAMTAFCALLALSPRTPSHSLCRRRPICCSTRDLYGEIGFPNGDAETPLHDLKQAYRAFAREHHPDTEVQDTKTFSRAADAWAVLSDPRLRDVYDAVGWPGVAALRSVEERSKRARALGLGGIDETLLDADSSLLEAGVDLKPPPSAEDHHEDACPRSIEEGVWNLENHSDIPTRYYALWWVYRFRVTEATDALTRVVASSVEPAKLRRRAALALGVVAGAPDGAGENAVKALADALVTGDYYVRYRAAEALAAIAQRHAGGMFAPETLQSVLRVLEKAVIRYSRARESRSGYGSQESLFDLESLEPTVRDTIATVFAMRRQNESRSRRTTMTPQLGVDATDDDDEPVEWLLKAAGGIARTNEQVNRVVEVAREFVQHDMPLVRYAAHKTLYALTGQNKHAETLVGALGYGVEHHYSQRVLIRDLGDVGYADGAKAMAECPMVENSFKVLALKNLLCKLGNDPHSADVRNVLKYMDSLL